MRPRYGFFNDYPMASGCVAHYDATSGRNKARLDLLVLPELAERLRTELSLDTADTSIALRLEVRERMLVLVPSLTATCHLCPTEQANGVESWTISFSPRSAGEVMRRLHFFGRLSASTAVLGKEIQFLLPSSCWRQSVVHENPLHEATEIAKRQLPILLRPGGPASGVTVEAPETRTLLLEGEDGNISSFSLPKRVAEAVATMVDPYRS